MASDHVVAGAAEERRARPSDEQGKKRANRSRDEQERSSTWVAVARAVVVLVILALWQLLPKIAPLRDISPIFDPFFVSSPTEVAEQIWNMAAGGRAGQPSLWPYLWDTLFSTFVGVAIALLLGTMLGLALSNSNTAQRVFGPVVVVLNATPRVALIPIFVIVSGPTRTASIITAATTVFFLVFYNAFAGGKSVPSHALQNARLLGATPRELLRQVRWPYVLVWTFASLPNAISFGLVSVVTVEILTGQLGMGQLLYNSINNVDATLTFSVVVVLSTVGVGLVTAADVVQRRVLHWWGGNPSD